MNPITHLLWGWCLADLTDLDRPLDLRARRVVSLAGLAPDLDGLGLVAELATRGSATPLFWYTDFHHRLAHNLFAAVAAAAVALALTRRLGVAALASLALLVHLACDLVGSRGPDGHVWPIPLLAPASERWTLAWSGQWELDAWPNVAITLALLAWTLARARTRGCSPVALVSLRADRAVVEALRRRFPPRAERREQEA